MRRGEAVAAAGGRCGCVAIHARAFNFQRFGYRRIAHAHIRAALVGEREAVGGGCGGLEGQFHHGLVVVHGLLAEKFVFLFLALRKLSRAQQAGWFGFYADFFLIEIIAVGNLKLHGHILLARRHRGAERLLRRQQLADIDCMRRHTGAQQHGQDERLNQFFKHKGYLKALASTKLKQGHKNVRGL